MCSILRFAAILAIFPSMATAWGLYDSMDNGSPILCVTPKQSAMGGVWAMPSSGAASVFLNPAELGTLEKLEVSISGGFIDWRDRFDGASVINIIHTGQGGTFTAAFGFPVSGKLSAGAGITRVSDMGFSGASCLMEEIGPNIYDIDALDIMNASGSLWEANAGFSAKLKPWLSVGLSGGVRFGRGSWDLIRDYVDPGVPSDSSSDSWEESDLCVHAGMLMPLNFATFAVSGTNGTDRYDSRIAIGMQKSIEKLAGSILGFELDAQSIEDDPEYAGRFFAVFNGMIQHVRSIYSLGFIQAAHHDHITPTMSTGATIDFNQIMIELGVAWTDRSRTGSIFPEPFINKVDDGGTYYSIGLTWKP